MTTIYALCDPGSAEIRYVGKTVWPLDRRRRAHIAEARTGARRHRCNWIRSLSSPPTIRPLVVVPDGFASEMETRAILGLKRKGYRLVNGTDGGEGAPGRKHTAEAKAKVSAANRGRKHTEETRRKVGAAGRGRRLSPEQCAARRGVKRPRTPEWQARLTAALPRGPVTPERRAKLIAQLRKVDNSWRKGRKLSPEHRAKISASLRGRPFTEEHRARAVAGIRATIARKATA